MRVNSMSKSEDLVYLGQQAVADAVPADADYRVVGGNMVRLLGLVYPTDRAIARSTVDADAAVDDVEIIAPLVDRLSSQGFTQVAGNLFVRSLDGEHRTEINILLSQPGPRSGMGIIDVPGVGQVDTLPELGFAMAQPAIELDMVATLTNDRAIAYTTRIPSLESAVVLKTHAWSGRRAAKDLLDLYSLLEIRDAHPGAPWRLDELPLRATRRDSAQILHALRATTLARAPRRGAAPADRLPEGVARLRMAALIERHVATI